MRVLTTDCCEQDRRLVIGLDLLLQVLFDLKPLGVVHGSTLLKGREACQPLPTHASCYNHRP